MMKKILFVLCAAGLIACNEAPNDKVESHAQVESETPVEKVVEKIEVNNESGGFTIEGSKEVPITNMSAVELFDLVQVNARPNRGITYNGYYSLLKKDGVTMLHGPFMAKSESAEVQDGVPGRSVYYKGTFYEGVPHDTWSERVKIVSAETKEDYNMTMHYDGGVCGKTVFDGAIHQDMKPKKVEFKGVAACDFATVRKKVEVAFKVEYKEALRKK